MDRSMDFTLNSENFLDLPFFVNEQHQKNVKFVPVLHPAINSQVCAPRFPSILNKTYYWGNNDNTFLEHVSSNMKCDFYF